MLQDCDWPPQIISVSLPEGCSYYRFCMNSSNLVKKNNPQCNKKESVFHVHAHQNRLPSSCHARPLRKNPFKTSRSHKSSYMVSCCPLEYYDTSLFHNTHGGTHITVGFQSIHPQMDMQHFDISTDSDDSPGSGACFCLRKDVRSDLGV